MVGIDKLGRYVIYLDSDGLSKEKIKQLETEITERCEKHNVTPLILNARARMHTFDRL